MFVGTGSDVGKSVVAAAFCRIFRQDGYRPAPFKAQNMSLNSYATPDGLELGRAQAVQAEAAGIPCEADMNPILLKPQSDHTSQVVLLGRPDSNQSAGSYFRKEGRDRFRNVAHEAFNRLASRFNPIVMEGAGSVSEINLREVDIVNMPMALYAHANVILVADIDRGGVFASIYGCIMLMTPEERSHIKGIIINKFRGDISLFESGAKMIEQLCGIPVLGILPYFRDIHIEEEDSVSLQVKSRQAVKGKVNVAVVLLRHMSNFTDFDALEQDSRLHLYYTNNPADLEDANIIIVPGSKSTIDDLCLLRQNGMAKAVVEARKRGVTVLGICGGYQILGKEVRDPNHVEGEIERLPGLGLLPVVTVIGGEKTTRQVTFQCPTLVKDENVKLRGYEIHMGTTTLDDNAQSMNLFNNQTTDGCFVDDRCMGTYIHGILDNAPIVDVLLSPYLKDAQEQSVFDYETYKNQQYDLLADHVRQHVDMERIYHILTTSD